MSANPPRDRKCANCRHYQASPLWRKGWCRNPLLFDPNTNHLVEADSLSCKRAFIDYWEAKAVGGKPVGPSGPPRPRVAPSIPLTPTGPGGAPLTSTMLGRAATAEALPLREKPPLSLVRPSPPPPAPEVAPSSAGTITAVLPVVEADLAPNLAATTSIRVQGVPPAEPAKPVPAAVSTRPRPVAVLGGLVGVALLLLAVVYWPVLTAKLPFGPKPPPTAVLPTPTTVALVVPPAPPPTDPPAPPPTETPVPPPPPPPVLGVGGFAVVIGTDSGRLNVRSAPATSGRVLGKVNQGTRLEIKGGPQNDGKRDWWQVVGWDSKGTLGWCSAEYLQPVQ